MPVAKTLATRELSAYTGTREVAHPYVPYDPTKGSLLVS